MLAPQVQQIQPTGRAAQMVAAAFPDVALVSMAAAAPFIGITEKTARNWLSAGRFPLATLKVGDKRLVPIPALVDWLERQFEAAGVATAQVAVAPADTDRPRRGTSTMEERAEAARLGMTVGVTRRRAQQKRNETVALMTAQRALW